MREIRIGERAIGGGHPVFIIAEAGINHQGELDIAKQLVDIAVAAGADAVKFQKRTIERILTKDALAAPYLGYNSFGPTYGEHRKHLELSNEEFTALKEHADSRGIIFLASGWDEQSVDFLESIGVLAFKMASADFTNLPLIEHTAKKGRPVILSSGMASMDEVRDAVGAVKKFNDQVGLLQCVSTYPSKFENINLSVIKTYLKEFEDVVIGYSGHELGIAIPIGAVALGAKIVERHFTLDRTMKGGDHAASLEPTGLTKLVRDLRHLEEAMGDGEKKLLEAELPIRKKLAKSIVAAVDIKKGEEIREEMLTAKSPGDGISPSRIHTVVGKTATRDIEEDTLIKEEDIG